MQLIIKDKVIILNQKQLQMIEEALYGAVMVRRLERQKKHCLEDDSNEMNALGLSIYKEEKEYDSIREQIDDAIGGA